MIEDVSEDFGDSGSESYDNMSKSKCSCCSGYMTKQELLNNVDICDSCFWVDTGGLSEDDGGELDFE